MPDYVFWSKDSTINVYPKPLPDAAEKQKLRKDGFKKVSFKVNAENEQQAVDALIANTKDNASALKEYIDGITTSSLTGSLIFFLTVVGVLFFCD